MRTAKTQQRGPGRLESISLAGWVRVSGPTFAVMLAGFTLLWNAQQATNTQMLEMYRTTGRLDAAIAGLERSIQGLDAQVDRFGERVDHLGVRIDGLSERIEGLAERMDDLSERMDQSG